MELKFPGKNSNRILRTVAQYILKPGRFAATKPSARAAARLTGTKILSAMSGLGRTQTKEQYN